MNREQLSEVNFGLVLEGRLPASQFKPEWFTSPFDDGIEILLKPGSTREDVAKVLSSAYMNDAHDAVKRMNGLGETENFDWAKSLRLAHDNYERGRQLEKVAKKLKENEDVDVLPLYSQLGSVIAQESFGLKPASEIDYKAYKPFKACGYDPIDKTLGGIPSDGPIIIYGLTGVGKSKFVTAIINGVLHKYPEETAAVYTLEMNEQHWLWRSLSLFPSLKEVLPRLHISGQVRDVEEMVAEVTARKVNYVVLDDMDNMVKSSDASEYERIYRRVKEVCRFMGIPVFVLGQPNRGAKIAVSNGERFLSKYDVAWSGAAENSAALQIAIQVANGLDMHSEEFPTADENHDYLIFWKSRDGWPSDYDPTKMGGPGAVIMESSKNWNGKPYSGKWKIWPVNSGGKAIGKKKREN
jgi:DNA replication protein DnaC